MQPRRSTYPLRVRLFNYVLAAFLLLVILRTFDSSLGAILGSLTLGLVVLVLCLLPVRASVDVKETEVFVSTVLGVHVIPRSQVRSWKTGPVGPVIVTTSGRKVRATAPIPVETWLFDLRIR